MNISFPQNYLSPERYRDQQNLQRVQESESGSKTVSTNRITADTGVDKEENDRLLRKVQLAQTKDEVWKYYLGALQTAVRESGSNGIVMARRVTHLTNTHKAYQQTEQYKNKKDRDTFVQDQIEALEKRQEEIAELRERQQEESQDVSRDARQDVGQDSRTAAQEAERNAREKSPERQTVAAAQTADLQKRAAYSYKTKDAPARNPSMPGVFEGMM